MTKTIEMIIGDASSMRPTTISLPLTSGRIIKSARTQYTVLNINPVLIVIHNARGPVLGYAFMDVLSAKKAIRKKGAQKNAPNVNAAESIPVSSPAANALIAINDAAALAKQTMATIRQEIRMAVSAVMFEQLKIGIARLLAPSRRLVVRPNV